MHVKESLHLRSTVPRLHALFRAMIFPDSFPAGVPLRPHFEAAGLSQHSNSGARQAGKALDSEGTL